MGARVGRVGAVGGDKVGDTDWGEGEEDRFEGLEVAHRRRNGWS